MAPRFCSHPTIAKLPDQSHLSKATMPLLRDRFDRPLQDLRISVTDQCNLRCLYCMPKEGPSTAQHVTAKQRLTTGEVVRLAKIFVSLGIRKIRITGGEPLLHKSTIPLIQQLSNECGVKDIALTTNGTLLDKHACALKHAGLDRITISLDSLDPDIYRSISGGKGDIRQVLRGIESARDAGFRQIKINTVIQKGINDHLVMDLVEFGRLNHLTIRFVEYMDVGTCNHWEERVVVPNIDILRLIHSQYPLSGLNPNYFGEVASRYQFKDGGGEIGFISSITQPFCGECTRLRLSAYGKLYSCLFASQGTDLCDHLRNGLSDREIKNKISLFWQTRDDRYSENRFLFRSLNQGINKIEMYQIGG